MMEQFIAAQTKTNESLSASINLLTSKFDAMITHQKAMGTQIAQQVSHLSRSQEHLPSQLETNSRGHVNAISTMRGGLNESLVMVF